MGGTKIALLFLYMNTRDKIFTASTFLIAEEGKESAFVFNAKAIPKEPVKLILKDGQSSEMNLVTFSVNGTSEQVVQQLTLNVINLMATVELRGEKTKEEIETRRLELKKWLANELTRTT